MADLAYRVILEPEPDESAYNAIIPASAQDVFAARDAIYLEGAARVPAPRVAQLQEECRRLEGALTHDLGRVEVTQRLQNIDLVDFRWCGTSFVWKAGNDVILCTTVEILNERITGETSIFVDDPYTEDTNVFERGLSQSIDRLIYRLGPETQEAISAALQESIFQRAIASTRVRSTASETISKAMRYDDRPRVEAIRSFPPSVDVTSLFLDAYIATGLGSVPFLDWLIEPNATHEENETPTVDVRALISAIERQLKRPSEPDGG